MTNEAESSNGKPSIPDSEIIDRFGGIRPMASKLGVAVTTVQGWKERGHIPQGRFPQIIEAAARHGVDIGLETARAPRPVKTAPEKEPEPLAAERIEAKEPEPKPQPKPQPKFRPEPVPEPAPAEEMKSATPTAAPARPGGGVSWIALIVVAVLLGGAVLTSPLWQSKLYPGMGGGSGSADAGRLDEIAAGLADIEASMKNLGRDLDAGERELSDRIDALEGGGGEAGAAFAGQLAAIEQGMSDLVRKLDELESSEGDALESMKTALNRADAAIGGLRDDVAELTQAARALQDGLASIGGNIGDLEGRVTTLETRPVQTGEKIAAMVLALGQVEGAMNSGRPYRAALERLELLGREDPVISESGAVATLSPWADHGISDRLILRSRFAELAPDIDRALSGAEEGNWLDNVWNSIAGLITVRRIDGSDPSPIAQAERALERGDLEGVATAFEGKGSLGPDGDAWLILVRARVDAEREIDALYGQIILPLAGRRDGSAAQ